MVKLKDNRQSLDYYFKSLKANEEVANNDGLNALNYAGIGGIYQEQGDLIKAKEYYITALRMADSLDDKILTGSTLVRIGALDLIQLNYKDAELHLHSALKISATIGNLVNQRDAYQKLSELYETESKWIFSIASVLSLP